MARWINRAIFFTSFFSIHWKGSKPFTSPANVQSNPVASNCVMGAIPLFPATRFFHTSSVPIPQAQTSPTPVTTTRRFKGEFFSSRKPGSELLLRLGVLIDVSDSVLHRGDLFRVLIGD